MIAVMISVLLSTGTPNFAQSVADAARQERERKRELAQHAAHVYTNEDLSKPHILVPEDEARVAAREKEPADSDAAVTAQADAPEAAPVASAAPVEVPDIPDIKDASTTPYSPVGTDAPANMLLPGDASQTAPLVVRSSTRPETAAPTVAGQSVSGAIAGLPVSANSASAVMLPAGVPDSKPRSNHASNRARTQAPALVGGVPLPATTMPFAAPVAYGPASISLPATDSKPVVRNSSNRRQAQAPAVADGIKIPATTMPFAAPAAYGPAGIAVPAIASKPAAREASNRGQIQAPASSAASRNSEVTMPVSAASVPANIALPAAASKPLVRELINRAQTQAPSPAAGIKVPAAVMPFAAPAPYAPASIALRPSASQPVARDTSNRVQILAPAPAATFKGTGPSMPVATPVATVPANIAAPTAVSKPLVRDASTRVQAQAPVPAVRVTSSGIAMPFATTEAYAPAKMALPVSAPSVARNLTRAHTAEIAPPVVVSPVTPAPMPLALAEHSIVRPVAVQAKKVDSATCAGPCETTVNAPAPVEILVRTEPRPDVGKTLPIPATRVLDLNRTQAIMDPNDRVKVERGDSLWKLARRYFGNGARWKRLAALNPQLADPNRLLVGEWIHVPSENKQSAKHVIIQPGDTLWRVARAELGSPLALNCLAQANPQLRSVDLVIAGETLIVPASCHELDRSQN